ncbi:hypothetical protein Tco_0731739, partial [Tanacetum coccineum]
YVRHAYMESVENTYVLIIFAYESSLAGIVIDKRGALQKQQSEQKAHVDLGCGRLTKVGCSSRVYTLFMWVLNKRLQSFSTSNRVYDEAARINLHKRLSSECPNDVGSNVFASDIGVVENVATRECPFDYPPDTLIDVGSQPSFVSTVATSTSMMSASDSVWTRKSKLDAEDAKLLGYTYTPDAVLDCVLMYLNEHAVMEQKIDSSRECTGSLILIRHLDPVREGHELFRKGLLNEAVLALDA